MGFWFTLLVCLWPLPAHARGGLVWFTFGWVCFTFRQGSGLLWEGSGLRLKKGLAYLLVFFEQGVWFSFREGLVYFSGGSGFLFGKGLVYFGKGLAYA